MSLAVLTDELFLWSRSIGSGHFNGSDCGTSCWVETSRETSMLELLLMLLLVEGSIANPLVHDHGWMGWRNRLIRHDGVLQWVSGMNVCVGTGLHLCLQPESVLVLLLLAGRHWMVGGIAVTAFHNQVLGRNVMVWGSAWMLVTKVFHIVKLAVPRGNVSWAGGILGWCMWRGQHRRNARCPLSFQADLKSGWKVCKELETYVSYCGPHIKPKIDGFF